MRLRRTGPAQYLPCVLVAQLLVRAESHLPEAVTARTAADGASGGRDWG